MMSCQQRHQKCQIPAKCLPKCPPKCPPQTPPVPALCPPPCTPPASSCCVSTCCISGFEDSCYLVPDRFPRVYLPQPQCSDCCENESSVCSSCCHSSGDCS
ncbi:late cornified envelope protein 7A [Castor canadensis]|uniref:Late cornified envelope protein 7A n=2 Tax=Castor canadensis TaxID=51338 RepID=A0AC58KJI5_CASCN